MVCATSAATLDLGQLKRAGARQGGATVNDMLMAALAGALRRYLEHYGTVGARVHALAPVNLRALELLRRRQHLDLCRQQPLGNKITLMVLPLPIGETTASGRLRHAQLATTASKSSAEPALWFVLSELLWRALPGRFIVCLMHWYMRKYTLFFTNVPGPAHKLHLTLPPPTEKAVDLERLLFWVPPVDCALSCGIVSYAGRVSVNVCVDAALRHIDPAAIALLVTDECATLCA
eukprot:TRINITY_DN3137_c1_g1_i1.p1 TRINITY_DN3137_c1_g1~~TRINITY_DN3137_c1_g1_i1.p1  ORF type:complete len:255 (+),score=59.23 TRINITY_DN3137_c1_g1_i1:64-765(+)